MGSSELDLYRTRVELRRRGNEANFHKTQLDSWISEDL